VSESTFGHHGLESLIFGIIQSYFANLGCSMRNLIGLILSFLLLQVITINPAVAAPDLTVSWNVSFVNDVSNVKFKVRTSAGETYDSNPDLPAEGSLSLDFSNWNHSGTAWMQYTDRNGQLWKCTKEISGDAVTFFHIMFDKATDQ
jgi:hypothetical protein